MAQRKPPKRLFKNQDVVHAYQHDRETKTSMKHMTRRHLDVLQNIEAILIAYYRKDDSIDDRMMEAALQKSIDRVEPGEESGGQAWALYHFLEQMRGDRSDVSDEIWRAGLRTVRDSVRRHSTLQPGDRSYIEFVSKYL